MRRTEACVQALMISRSGTLWWDSSGGTARGRITRVAKSGSIDVPDSSFTINADEDDPAALIRVYRKGDDGFEDDRLVGHQFSTLTRLTRCAVLPVRCSSVRTRLISTRMKRTSVL